MDWKQKAVGETMESDDEDDGAGHAAIAAKEHKFNPPSNQGAAGGGLEGEALAGRSVCWPQREFFIDNLLV